MLSPMKTIRCRAVKNMALSLHRFLLDTPSLVCYNPPINKRRIRLAAQDTSLSRRRPPVRIRYALPSTDTKSTPLWGAFLVAEFW
jgi:hypothetical protein